MNQELINFLKVLEKKGYPNPKIRTIANLMDYDLDTFIPDLYDEIGLEKTNNFVDNGLEKLLGSDRTITLDMTDFNYDENSFIKFEVYSYGYDPDESVDGVYANLNIVESNLIDNGVAKTYEEIESEVDFSDWNEWGEFKDQIFGRVSETIFNNLGFWLYQS